MFNLSAMSPAELQFIRLYITTLRREYHLLRSVIDVMNPEHLGVKSFVDATNISLRLAEMQQDFDSRLRQVQKKNDMRTLATVTVPTTDELADLFSLSFFKLITTGKLSTLNKGVNNGWFSGKPTDWKATLLHHKNVPKDKVSFLPDMLTDFFNAALKLFPFDNKGWFSEHPNVTKKVWPPTPKNWYFDDDIDDIDDDDDTNPFGWLFGDAEE